LGLPITILNAFEETVRPLESVKARAISRSPKESKAPSTLEREFFSKNHLPRLPLYASHRPFCYHSTHHRRYPSTHHSALPLYAPLRPFSACRKFGIEHFQSLYEKALRPQHMFRLPEYIIMAGGGTRGSPNHPLFVNYLSFD